MNNVIDFEGLSAYLLSRSRDIVPSWFPGGKMRGREYVIGDLQGREGDSLSINLDSGKWADFAGTEKGGDLISLWAAINGLSQSDSALQLADQHGFKITDSNTYQETVIKPRLEGREILIPPPDKYPYIPEDAQSWCYRNAEGEPIFYVVRKETEGKKQYYPISWNGSDWVLRGVNAPRPIYGLELLAQRPNDPVLVCEGEKACEAARTLLGSHFVCITWPNGVNSISKVDWTPIHGRHLLLWPDNDEPGIKAMNNIAEMLFPFNGEQGIRIIMPEGDEGVDAADYLEAGWDAETIIPFLKARTYDYKKPELEPVYEEPEPEINIQSEATQVIAQAGAVVNISVPDDEVCELDLGQNHLYITYGLPQTKDGKPILDVDAVAQTLEKIPDLKDVVWYDDFYKRYFTKWNGGKLREWTDEDDINFTRILQVKLGMRRISDDLVHKGIRAYASNNKRNAPRDWLSSLSWDGTERIEQCFITHFGAEPSDYMRAASKNWWVSMAARIFRPGCQVDNMVVLEGGQGTFKSSSLRLIGRDWYAESHEHIMSKDFYIQLQGKFLIEIAELDTFNRVEVNTIKKVVTNPVDRYRTPYGRGSQDFPRQCVFVGTTNESHYLRDATGGRRFWPVKIGKIDLDLIANDRDQFFAEAVHWFNSGHKWYEMPEEQTLAEQENRREVDVWEEPIASYLKLKDEVSLQDITTECLKIDIGKVDMSVMKRVGKVMRVLRWTRHQVGNFGDRHWVYRSPDYFPEPLF